MILLISIVYLGVMIVLDLAIQASKLIGFAIIDIKTGSLKQNQVFYIELTIIVVFTLAFPAITILLTYLIMLDLS